MIWWQVGVVAVVIVGVIVANRLGWIDLSSKNRSSGSSGVMGIGDEVFHPTRHEASLELERQTVLPAPAPLAGDGDKGVYGGTVHIELDDEHNGQTKRR